MKTTLLALVLHAAFGAAAFAQGYSQPVREVDKEARSAVRGTCEISVDAGYVGNLADCAMADFTQNLGATVPAGKILVIEDLSATCFKPNADLTTSLILRAGSFWKPLPLQLLRTTSNGRQSWVLSQQTRLYVPAGEKVWVSIDTGSNATQHTACGVRFQGHLVNAQ